MCLNSYVTLHKIFLKSSQIYDFNYSIRRDFSCAFRHDLRCEFRCEFRHEFSHEFSHESRPNFYPTLDVTLGVYLGVETES